MGRVGRPRAAYPGKEGRPRFHPERVASAPWHSSWNGTTPSGLADLRWGRGTRGVRLRRPTLRYETEPLRGIGEDLCRTTRGPGPELFPWDAQNKRSLLAKPGASF